MALQGRGFIVCEAILVGCQPQSRSRLDFEDLIVGTRYRRGSSFTTGSTTITAATFHAGAYCGKSPLTNGYAVVTNQGLTCGTCKKLVLVDINLRFNFGGPIPELRLIYRGYGNINIEVNRECRIYTNMAGLNGVNIGGVSVSVRAKKGQQFGLSS